MEKRPNGVSLGWEVIYVVHHGIYVSIMNLCWESVPGQFTKVRLIRKPSMVMLSMVLSRLSNHMDNWPHMVQYFHGIHLFNGKENEKQSYDTISIAFKQNLGK